MWFAFLFPFLTSFWGIRDKGGGWGHNYHFLMLIVVASFAKTGGPWVLSLCEVLIDWFSHGIYKSVFGRPHEASPPHSSLFEGLALTSLNTCPWQSALAGGAYPRGRQIFRVWLCRADSSQRLLLEPLTHRKLKGPFHAKRRHSCCSPPPLLLYLPFPSIFLHLLSKAERKSSISPP